MADRENDNSEENENVLEIHVSTKDLLDGTIEIPTGKKCELIIDVGDFNFSI